MAAPTKSGSGDGSCLPPPLEWAQRKDRVWITVALENCPKPEYRLEPCTFYFRGKGGTENVDHEVTLELFGEIDKEKSGCQANDRHSFFTLFKKDKDASYWPHLTKEKKKLHFLKTDFNRWRDEDDSEEEEEKEDFSLDSMMSSMGGLKESDLGGDAENEADSDDEDLPDLQ